MLIQRAISALLQYHKNGNVLIKKFIRALMDWTPQIPQDVSSLNNTILWKNDSFITKNLMEVERRQRGQGRDVHLWWRLNGNSSTYYFYMIQCVPTDYDHLPHSDAIITWYDSNLLYTVTLHSSQKCLPTTNNQETCNFRGLTQTNNYYTSSDHLRAYEDFK